MNMAFFPADLWQRKMEGALQKKMNKATFCVQIDFKNRVMGHGKIQCFENNREAEFEGALQLIKMIDCVLRENMFWKGNNGGD